MRQLTKYLRRYWADVACVALFAAISFAYFMPADIEGRILYRHDSAAGRGAGQEQQAFLEQTGERTRWTNATFSGMPTYQTAPSYESTDMLSKAMDVYHLWLPENVWYVFAYLLGFYILLRALAFRQRLAALGAILWAFSSYFFIIIAAGHIWKVMALAYLPPMIAGVALAYRGRYISGFIVTAVFTAFEVKANHVQMTYYFLFVLLFMLIAWLVQAVRERQMARFAKATAVCIAAAAVGIGINLSNLYHTWQYGQESMRGKSELVKKNAANQTASGLDRDYITQWSYGIGETWTLLVPNTKGGASMPLSQDDTAMKKADVQLAQFYDYFAEYWGDQPGTSGPVYVGAFVLMLFVLGLFIVRGPMKWALLTATILSVLLSWGRNFMPFTDFFLDYIPMYAKFRTVASILVIAEFTIPLLAMMTLKQLTEDPGLLAQKIRYLYVSLALTAGIALLFALMPDVFFQFISSGDIATAQQIEQAVAQQQPESAAGLQQALLANLADMHKAVFTADCWRSIVIIAVGTLLLLLFKARKLKASYMVAAIAALCLADMWSVNKRYLNDGMFVERSVRETPQPMTETDRQILQDKTLDYRVLNLASNTFNENETSYYHKSIGGYHAAKLRRYQELIDAYISPEMQQMMPAIAQAQGDMTAVPGDSIWPVLNALNTRYVIMPLQGGQTVPIQNPYAYGNAWFVDRLKGVDNANEELDLLGKTDLRKEAVYDRQAFQQVKHTGQTTTSQEHQALVTLDSYQPNELHYTTENTADGTVVFSEIYYPGWTATIDGKPATLFRVDYVLRALQVPQGKHAIVLAFRPASIRKTETVAYVSYALLALAVVAGMLMEWRRRRDRKAVDGRTQ